MTRRKRGELALLRPRNAKAQLARALVAGRTTHEAAAEHDYIEHAVRGMLKRPDFLKLMAEQEADLNRVLRGRLLDAALTAADKLRKVVDGKAKAVTPAQVTAYRVAIELSAKVGVHGRAAALEQKIEKLRRESTTSKK